MESIGIPSATLLEATLDPAFVAKFALFLATVLIGTAAIGKFLKSTIRLPSIAGQIVGGIVLGPTLLNIKALNTFTSTVKFTDQLTGTICSISSSDLFLFWIVLISSSLTVGYLLWIAGHETQLSDLLKVGATATTAGILGAAIPIGLALIAGHFWLPAEYTPVVNVCLGLVLSATSVSIPVAYLVSRNKMHLRSSNATLGAAIIDDIVAVVLLSIFAVGLQTGWFGDLGINTPLGRTEGAAESMVYMILCFALIGLVGYFLIPPTVRLLRRNPKTIYLIPTVATGTMLFYFSFAEIVGGLAGITGAYFAGLFHKLGDKSHKAERLISPFTRSILLPLFLGSIGMQVDLSILSAYDWMVIGLLIVVAIISKLGACLISTTLVNFTRKVKSGRWTLLESYLFGASMVARGEVGLVIATVLKGMHLLGPHQYVIAVVIILLTTIASPILLSVGFAIADKEEKGTSRTKFSFTTGTFPALGTTHVFHIVVRLVEKSKLFGSSAQFSDNKKLVILEAHRVKIILDPQKGITFEGDRTNIEKILSMVREELGEDIQQFSE